MSALAHPELALARKSCQAEVPAGLIERCPCMTKAIALCVQLSGLDDKEVYLALEIDAGHWSRIMKGDAHFPPNKLNDLMDLCGNKAPLMWLALSRGKGLVLLKTEAEKRAEKAERDLADERTKTAMLMELLSGRKVA